MPKDADLNKCASLEIERELAVGRQPICRNIVHNYMLIRMTLNYVQPRVVTYLLDFSSKGH